MLRGCCRVLYQGEVDECSPSAHQIQEAVGRLEHRCHCMYTVHCTLYTVHCTRYKVHGTLYTVHSTLYCTDCTVSTVCTVCRVCTVCTGCIVCTVCIVCTICTADTVPEGFCCSVHCTGRKVTGSGRSLEPRTDMDYCGVAME